MKIGHGHVVSIRTNFVSITFQRNLLFLLLKLFYHNTYCKYVGRYCLVGIRITYNYEKLNEKPKTTIIRPGVSLALVGVKCEG